MTASRNPDGLDDYEGDELRQEIIRRARTEGLKIAYRSAIEVASDAKAPSQARTNAQRTIMMVAGVLDRKDRENDVDKDPATMNGDELNEALAHLMRDQAATEARLDQQRRPQRLLRRNPSKVDRADGLFD